MFSRQIFAERLKLLRKEKGVPQITIAKLLGVTRTQIGDLELGKTTTSIERLYTLAEYYQVTLDYLVGRSDLGDD